MKIYFILLFMVLSVCLSAQVRPDQTPTKTPDGNDAIYTQETGALNKVKFSEARKYFGSDVNLVDINYVPSASGNTLNLNEFVRVASTGDIWFIDAGGDAFRFSGNLNQVANVAARDALLSPYQNDVAIIVDSDGKGRRGISYFDDGVWTSPEFFDDVRDDGNVLYVSINGNNSNAERGNPEKPFRDPWFAKDNSLAGDIIEVLPGEYTIDTIQGSDCVPINGIPGSCTLFKDSIIYKFNPGVIINNNTPFSGNALFFDTISTLANPKSCSVFGSLDFNINSDGSFANFDKTGNFYAEINRLVVNPDSWTQNGALFKSWSSKNVIIKVNEVEIGNTELVRFGGNQQRSNISVKIGCLTDKDSDTTFEMFCGSDSITANIDIDYYHLVSYSFYLFDLQGVVNCSQSNSLINVNINNFKVDPSSIVNGFIFRYGNNLINSTFNYTLNNFFSDKQLFQGFGTNLGDKLSSINVDIGNAVYTGKQSFIDIEGVSRMNINANVVADSASSIFQVHTLGEIFISGNYFNQNNPVIEVEGGVGLINFSGNFKTDSGKPVLNFTSKTANIMLKNAVLINDGTVAAIQSNIDSTNVIINNVFTNSMLIDTFIFELVEPVVRNVNVK